MNSSVLWPLSKKVHIKLSQCEIDPLYLMYIPSVNGNDSFSSYTVPSISVGTVKTKLLCWLIHLLIIFVNMLTPQPTEQFCLYCSNTFGGHYIYCRIIATEYSSFERQLLILDTSSPVAIVIIYRPPRVQNEFGDFLGGLFSKFDKLLILGGFNINVCCPENVMMKDF